MKVTPAAVGKKPSIIEHFFYLNKRQFHFLTLKFPPIPVEPRFNCFF
jgi:hypothetical protein